jgi:predicted enzyme related to lactoylglutathione lyase
MPTFDSYPAGSPCWIDLMSPDVEASKAFYSAVFGWDASDEHDDDGNWIYTQFRQDGNVVAGMGGQPPEMDGMPAMWNTYIATNDVNATAAAVTEAGGSVMMPPMAVMDAGHMAIFADPTGAAFSAWQAGNHHGAQIANDAGTWSWNELLTRDVDAAKDFYAKVFGWTYDSQEMPGGMVYTVIAGGDYGGLGGVMDMPEGIPEQVPSHWMVYFSVADINATVEAVKANGGQIVVEPFEAPGVGHIATAHDGHGGMFSLMQPAQS